MASKRINPSSLKDLCLEVVASNFMDTNYRESIISNHLLPTPLIREVNWPYNIKRNEQICREYRLNHFRANGLSHIMGEMLSSAFFNYIHINIRESRFDYWYPSPLAEHYIEAMDNMP